MFHLLTEGIHGYLDYWGVTFIMSHLTASSLVTENICSLKKLKKNVQKHECLQCCNDCSYRKKVLRFKKYISLA